MLRKWQAEDRVVAVCPEVDGGLTVPRPAAEIVGQDSGRGVIARLSFVRTARGSDVTAAYIAGAARALEAARAHGVRLAVLKDGSPSCASSFVYDGTFSGRRITGMGVTVALLEASGIRVFSENEIDAAEAFLQDRIG